MKASKKAAKKVTKKKVSKKAHGMSGCRPGVIGPTTGKVKDEDEEGEDEESPESSHGLKAKKKSSKK